MGIRARMPLLSALRELGRIERTIFTLKWLQEPALRWRVSAGLNKGEAGNALAPAPFSFIASARSGIGRLKINATGPAASIWLHSTGSKGSTKQ